jgi:hypothetical protein
MAATELLPSHLQGKPLVWWWFQRSDGTFHPFSEVSPSLSILFGRVPTQLSAGCHQNKLITQHIVILAMHFIRGEPSSGNACFANPQITSATYG